MLLAQAAHVAAALRAIRSDVAETIIKAAIEAVKTGLSEAYFEAVEDALADYSATSGAAAYGQTAATIETGVFDQINHRAAAWANEQAATLVSQVDEATRNAVRKAVADGLASGKTSAEIADAIEGIDDLGGLPAFGKERASLIAHTEIANANSAGALIGYKAARDGGVNVMKRWYIAPGDKVCVLCQENADAGPINLDAEFPSGHDAPLGHVNCRCSLAPHLVY